MKSSSLPPNVRAAAHAELGSQPFREEFAWMSWAGTVWRLTGRDGAVYLKRAADLAGERDRLDWLSGRWPVPEVAGFFHELGDDWLLTRQVAGVPMSDPSLGWTPKHVAETLGEMLRGLHSTDASSCPFGAMYFSPRCIQRDVSTGQIRARWRQQGEISASSRQH